MKPIPTAQRSIEMVDVSIAFGQGSHRRQVVENVSLPLAQGE